MQFLQESLIELITQTSTNLPPDVREAMGIALREETPGTQGAQALNIIASNIDMAESDEGPICQDTGMPTFDVHTPVGVSQIEVKRAIRAAVAEATKRGKLRPNSVDSLTGKNSGDNLGVETPVIHFEQWERDEIEVIRRFTVLRGICSLTSRVNVFSRPRISFVVRASTPPREN